MSASSNIPKPVPESVRPGEGPCCDTGDLRRCIDHNIPVNRCALCLPRFLSWLGRQCVAGWIFRPSSFEPFHPLAILNSTLRAALRTAPGRAMITDASDQPTEAKP